MSKSIKEKKSKIDKPLLDRHTNPSPSFFSFNIHFPKQISN